MSTCLHSSEDITGLQCMYACVWQWDGVSECIWVRGEREKYLLYETEVCTCLNLQYCTYSVCNENSNWTLNRIRRFWKRIWKRSRRCWFCSRSMCTRTSRKRASRLAKQYALAANFFSPFHCFFLISSPEFLVAQLGCSPLRRQYELQVKWTSVHLRAAHVHGPRNDRRVGEPRVLHVAPLQRPTRRASHACRAPQAHLRAAARQGVPG